MVFAHQKISQLYLDAFAINGTDILIGYKDKRVLCCTNAWHLFIQPCTFFISAIAIYTSFYPCWTLFCSRSHITITFLTLWSKLKTNCLLLNKLFDQWKFKANAKQNFEQNFFYPKLKRTWMNWVLNTIAQNWTTFKLSKAPRDERGQYFWDLVSVLILKNNF